MKNYKVITIDKYNKNGFKDLTEDVWRYVGDEFYCTKERYEFLKSKGAVELIEIEVEKLKVIDHTDNNLKLVKKKKIDKKRNSDII